MLLFTPSDPRQLQTFEVTVTKAHWDASKRGKDCPIMVALMERFGQRVLVGVDNAFTEDGMAMFDHDGLELTQAFDHRGIFPGERVVKFTQRELGEWKGKVLTGMGMNPVKVGYGPWGSQGYFTEAPIEVPTKHHTIMDLLTV